MERQRQYMYELLSRLYKQEVDMNILNQLSKIPTVDTNKCQDESETLIAKGYNLISKSLDEVSEALEENLAVDFARTFLGAGIADGKAAFPYESYYTSKKAILMQEAWEEVKKIYEESRLSLKLERADLKEDHIACELEFMAYMIKNKFDIGEQICFLTSHLINWCEKFFVDIEEYSNEDFYKGVALLTKGFLKAELDYLNKEASMEKQVEFTYELNKEEFTKLLDTLKDKYDVYAPKIFNTGAGKNKETVKYAKINKYEDIVYDKQSDFSPKEIYSPVSQTMFYFTESEVIESNLKSEKGILVFLRPCDINGAKHLDQMFLNNGNPDYYYDRLRRKVKFAMIECRESFDNCFCVSLGTNVTDDYALAVRFRENGALLKLKDEELKKFFADAKVIENDDFTVEFVKENNRSVVIPEIKDLDTLKKVSELELWDEFNDKCIACGGCNTVCGTCSCFDTVDIIYKEGSNEGERKRVWSSCMLETFTETAGGSRTRKTQGANMRFKVLHKFYDYKARFGKDHMCVGCGRCIRRCPKEIDFLKTVNKLSDVLNKGGENE